MTVMNNVKFMKVQSSICPDKDTDLGIFQMLHLPLAGEKVVINGGMFIVYERKTFVSTFDPRDQVVIRVIPEA
jgi:hypothetical protein